MESEKLASLPLKSSPDSSVESTCSMSDQGISGVSDIVGDFGLWQKRIFLFFLLCSIFSAWHSLAISFYAPTQDYTCTSYSHPHTPSLTTTTTTITTSSVGDRHDFVEDPVSSQCILGNGSYCTSWLYDPESGHTITQEWNLVCSRSWLVSLTKSFYMFGTLCAVLLSQMADRVGRFPIVFGGVILEVTAGLASAFAPNIETYLVSRFLLAMGNAARWGSGFVIILEVVGVKYRGDLGIGIEFGWAIGYVLIPLVAYFIRDFRKLQLVSAIPQVIFIYLCWIWIPESPRWQLTTGRRDGAEKSIFHAGKINGIKTEKVSEGLDCLTTKYRKEGAKGVNASATVIDLWRHRCLRKRTFLLYFTWIVNAFVYYGLSFNTNSLNGNPYINFALSGAVEIPAYALTMVAIQRFGRKGSLVYAMMGAAACFLLIVPSTLMGVTLMETTFTMAGKFFITSSYAILYLYSCEVYPTVVRTVGLGSSSMVGRVGAIAAPFVKEFGEATHMSIALGMFGLLSLVNAGLIHKFGQETGEQDMPDTLDQVELSEPNLKDNILFTES